jgi:hypothetical protein
MKPTKSKRPKRLFVSKHKVPYIWKKDKKAKITTPISTQNIAKSIIQNFYANESKRPKRRGKRQKKYSATNAPPPIFSSLVGNTINSLRNDMRSQLLTFEKSKSLSDQEKLLLEQRIKDLAARILLLSTTKQSTTVEEVSDLQKQLDNTKKDVQKLKELTEKKAKKLSVMKLEEGEQTPNSKSIKELEFDIKANLKELERTSELEEKYLSQIEQKSEEIKEDNRVAEEVDGLDIFLTRSQLDDSNIQKGIEMLKETKKEVAELKGEAKVERYRNNLEALERKSAVELREWAKKLKIPVTQASQKGGQGLYVKKEQLIQNIEEKIGKDDLYDLMETPLYMTKLEENNYDYTKVLPKNKNNINGKGLEKGSGLTNFQIEKIVSTLNSAKPNSIKGFKGVFPIDKLDEVARKCSKSDEIVSFIINLDDSTEKGSHWCAVYIDKSINKSINYYDSYAREPPLRFLKDIELIVAKIKPKYYLKLKVNRIVQQSVSSDTCGWFSLRFLFNMSRGQEFKDCTRFSEVKKGEKDIAAFKAKYKKFDVLI